MQVVGICRFSLIGRGDWLAYRGKSDTQLEAIYKERAKTLFAGERIESRLASFEHLTLRSMQGQSDKDFLFVVCASELMPAEYQLRLRAICAQLPQVHLRFFPPMHVIDAQKLVFAELGLDQADCVQFRLDDDDCVFADYIRRLKECSKLMDRYKQFAVSFPDLLYAITSGPNAGIYKWYAPFFSAGPALRHPSRSIYGYGHFAIPKRMPSIMRPGLFSLATFDGQNDSAPNFERIMRREFERPSKKELERILGRDLHFLAEEGRRIAALEMTPSQIEDPARAQ